MWKPSGASKPVLWIRDILVRIRIRASVPLTYGVRNRILLSSRVADKMPENKSFFSSFFVEHFLKVEKSNKKSQRSRKEIKVLNFFFLLMEGSGSVQIITDPRGPKRYRSYGSGSTTLASTLIRILQRRSPHPGPTYTWLQPCKIKCQRLCLSRIRNFSSDPGYRYLKYIIFWIGIEKKKIESIDIELNLNLSIYNSKNC